MDAYEAFTREKRLIESLDWGGGGAYTFSTKDKPAKVLRCMRETWFRILVINIKLWKLWVESEGNIIWR